MKKLILALILCASTAWCQTAVQYDPTTGAFLTITNSRASTNTLPIVTNNQTSVTFGTVNSTNFMADGYNLEGGFNGLSVSDPVLTFGVDTTGVTARITIDGETTPIRYWFGNHVKDYGTGVTVRLTAGASNAPALNYICAMEQGYITNFTSYPYFPTSGVSRAIMFECFLMDTNSVANGSGYALRSWTDNYANRRGLGRTSWIGERVRRLPAIWESGVQVSLNATNASTNTAYVMVSSGVGWQMHSHTIPEITAQTNMWVINHPWGFRSITNLQEITLDANSNAVLSANSDCFAINVFVFVESGITPKSTRVMLTYSTDDYTGGVPAQRLSDCIADAMSYDVTGVPVWMQGMTIRVGRVVIRRDSATARTYWVYDRRGQPLGTAGGGSASSGESDPLSLHLDGSTPMTGNLNYGGQSGTNIDDLVVSGYTTLGNAGTAIKMLCVTGLTASTQGGQTLMAHGLDSSKIIGSSGAVQLTPTNHIPPAFAAGYGGYTGFNWNFLLTPTYVEVMLHSTDSGSITSKPYTVTIIYKE